MSSNLLVFEKELPQGKFCLYQERPDFYFLKVKQTHSTIVLNESTCHESDEADGIVGTGKTPKAILTADCLPIVIIGELGHACLHAGWRGLAQNIIGTDEVKKIRPFYAFIGPHISLAAYEVQADFKEHFNNEGAFLNKNGKIYFDLSVIAREQLANQYPKIKIEEAKLCTFETNFLHSFRRNKTNLRNWNLYIP